MYMDELVSVSVSVFKVAYFGSSVEFRLADP